MNLRDRAQRAIDQKTKPPGSLGRLEACAVQLAMLQGTLTPQVTRGRIVVFAADHGVTAAGVSAYPRQVTAEMVRNFARGGAAINVLARANDLELEVVDVGVDADFTGLDGIVPAKVAPGSANFLEQPAMSPAMLAAALAAGRAAATRAAAAGVHMLGLGEMGIGNTTSAAALLSALTGAPVDETTGRGTGVDDEGLRRKREVVASAIARHAPFQSAESALAAVGGLELAAIAGAAMEGAARRMAVVVDGFISTVAVLAAVRIDPGIREALFFGHRSAERGHQVALAALDATPLLDLDLRLGEGTGAALAMPLLRSAAAILNEMATFAEAGVSGG